jgi:hypothetical protein
MRKLLIGSPCLSPIAEVWRQALEEVLSLPPRSVALIENGSASEMQKAMYFVGGNLGKPRRSSFIETYD